MTTKKSAKKTAAAKIEWPAHWDPAKGWPTDAAAPGLTPEQLEAACVRLGKPKAKKHPAELAGKKIRRELSLETTPNGCTHPIGAMNAITALCKGMGLDPQEGCYLMAVIGVEHHGVKEMRRLVGLADKLWQTIDAGQAFAPDHVH